MKLASISLVLVLAGAAGLGCGGSQRRAPAAHWDDTPATTVVVTPPPDGGVDAGVAPGLAVFQRSCTPCHRRSGGDPYATNTNVFFETEADFRQWASSDTMGHTNASLSDVLSLRADGLDLIVGANRSVMPPRGSSVPALTPEDARVARDWLRTQR